MVAQAQTTPSPLADAPTFFHGMVAKVIDEDGIFPHPLLAVSRDDTAMIGALAVPPADVYASIVMMLVKEDPKELIFGMDRYVKPEQGNPFKDCLGGCYYNGTLWKPFIIDYQHEPRIVNPIRWDNECWNVRLTHELLGVFDGVIDAIAMKTPANEELAAGIQRLRLSAAATRAAIEKSDQWKPLLEEKQEAARLAAGRPQGTARRMLEKVYNMFSRK